MLIYGMPLYFDTPVVQGGEFTGRSDGTQNGGGSFPPTKRSYGTNPKINSFDFPVFHRNTWWVEKNR